MRSPKRRRASMTSRDLPMPDSPVIERIAPLPSAIAWQAVVEDGALAAAADQRHDGAHLGGPARARHARGAQRALQSAQLDLAERLELDAVAHLALGLRARRRCRRRGASSCSRAAMLAVSPSAL